MDENPYEPGMYSSQLDRINEGRSFPKATYLESSRVRALTQNNIIKLHVLPIRKTMYLSIT